MLFSAIGNIPFHRYIHTQIHICICVCFCVCVRPTKNKPHLQHLEIFQLSHTLTQKLMQLIWNRESGVGSREYRESNSNLVAPPLFISL